MDANQIALLDFLMDDDSSSSSSDSSDWGSFEELSDDLEFEFLTSQDTDVTHKGRFKNGDECHPSAQVSDEEFYELYRVNRNLVDELAVKYRESSFWNSSCGKHGRIGALEAILMFLWFAGHEGSFRGLSLQFGVTISSCHRIVKRVAAFFRSIFDIIKWPDEADMAESSLYFQRRGLPQVIGAINVTHIEIDKLLSDAEDFKNASNKFSIQVICDYRKRIIHMYTGAPGSETVGDVFEGSGLNEGLEPVCGDYWIMGDYGYPCLKNLLVPFRPSEQDLTPEQDHFNHLLSFGKSLVNDFFKKLRTKFPQLGHVRLRTAGDVNNFITACCVLYNLSLDDDFFRDAEEAPLEHNSHYFLVNADDERRQIDGDLPDSVEGVEFRDSFVAALKLASR